MNDPLSMILIAAGAGVIGAAASRGFGPGRAGATADPVAPVPESGEPSSPMEGGAVILLDVDRLGALNRSEGFDTGDRLLDRIADMLCRALPDGAGLERLESGRFAVWMPNADLDAAVAQAEQFRKLAAEALVPASEGTVARTLSAGVTIMSGDEGRARALLHADAALTRGKSMGGDRVVPAQDRTRPPTLSTREEVAAAIASGELAYHLQPIMDLHSGARVGAEALLRWRRPDGRIIGPDTFVDQMDRIPPAGADLIPDLAAAAAAGPIAEGAHYVAFNVTGAVLDGRDGPGQRWLDGVIERIPVDRLVLEIVESALIVEPARCAALLDDLRGRGIRIALDDFGTGLSNMERLCRYPVDILKIDRSFVAALDGDGRAKAVMASISDLARGLGMAIIAEGIETERQAQTIRDLGIGYGQGWLYGKPAPAA